MRHSQSADGDQMMEYHVWSAKKKTCDCCGLTLNQIHAEEAAKRAVVAKNETLSNFWLAMLDLFEQDVDDDGYWHGPQCRRCSGAPQSVGEMFLAKFSEGQWLCNKCYARAPEDTKGRWVFMPVEKENEDDELSGLL